MDVLMRAVVHIYVISWENWDNVQQIVHYRKQETIKRFFQLNKFFAILSLPLPHFESTYNAFYARIQSRD